MTALFKLSSTTQSKACEAGGKGNFRPEISADEYDDLCSAIEVINALWRFEEAYDVVQQNGIEFEIALARQSAYHRANISLFPDEMDLEIRQLNRLLLNLLASARAFIDGTKAALPRSLAAKKAELKAIFSQQSEASFSYRLMNTLRNQTQHRAAVIQQSLLFIRTWTSSSGETVRVPAPTPQIARSALLDDERLPELTRLEIETCCSEAIDLTPHIEAYIQDFGVMTDRLRALFATDLATAKAALREVLGDHLADDWGHVWVIPEGDPVRRQTLSTSAYQLRRLSRIRLRNYALPIT